MEAVTEKRTPGDMVKREARAGPLKARRPNLFSGFEVQELGREHGLGFDLHRQPQPLATCSEQRQNEGNTQSWVRTKETSSHGSALRFATKEKCSDDRHW